MPTNFTKLIGQHVTPIFPFGFIGRPWDNFYCLEKYFVETIDEEKWHCFDLGNVLIFVDFNADFLMIDENLFIITDRFFVKTREKIQHFSRGAIRLIGAPARVERNMGDIVYAMNGAIKQSAKLKQ